MAIIPRASVNKAQSLQFSASPTQSIEGAGLVGKAMQGMGEGLKDVAGLFNEIHKKQEAIEADSFAQNSALDAELEIIQKDEENKKKFQGNHKGYAESNAKLVDSVMDKYNKNAPSKNASMAFKNRFASSERRFKIGGLSYEQEQKTKFLYTQDQQLINKYATVLNNVPDTNKAVQSLGAIDATLYMKDKYTAEQSNDYSIKARESVFEGLMGGFENTEDPETAMEILEGTHPNAKEILKTIDEGKIQQWKRRFENQIKTQSTVNKSLRNDQLKDAEATIYDRNVKMETGQLNQLQSVFQSVNDVNAVQTLEILKASNDAIATAKTMNTKEIDKMLAGGVQNLPQFKVTSQGMNAAEKVRLEKKLSGALENIKKERNEKGGDFVLNEYSNIQNLSAQAADIDNPQAMAEYSKTSIETQKSLGIENPKVLNDQLAKTYGDQLKTKDPAYVASVVQKLKQGFGSSTGSLAKELVDREIISSEMAYTFYMDDKDSVLGILELQDKEVMKDVEASYKLKMEQDSGDGKAEISDLLESDDFVNFKKALVDSVGEADNLKITNTLAEIMQKDYKRLRSSTGVSEKDARSKIIKKYMGNWKITSNNTPVVIPTAEVMRNGYDVNKIEDGVDDIKSYMPEINQVMQIPAPASYAGQEDKWKRDLHANTKLVTSPEMDGVILVMDNGASKPPAIKGKDGNVVKFTYKEIHDGFDLNKEIKDKISSAKNSSNKENRVRARLGMGI